MLEALTSPLCDSDSKKLLDLYNNDFSAFYNLKDFSGFNNPELVRHVYKKYCFLIEAKMY